MSVSAHKTHASPTTGYDARPSGIRTAIHQPDLRFWLGFFALNFLIFLPGYLLTYQDAAFLPRGGLVDLLVARENSDIFRFNLELSLLILSFPLIPWLWSRTAQRWWARAIFLLFLLALVYAIYESITLSLYQTNPVFFNDYRFFVGGIGFLVDGLQLRWWHLLGVGLILLATPILLYKLILRWFGGVAGENLSRFSRVAALAVMMLLFGFALARHAALARPQSEVVSLTAKITANARASRQAQQRLALFESIQPEQVYDYADTVRLIRKPDITLIFVESYGSVLYQRLHFTDDYLALMAEMAARLEDGGWEMATGLSESPTWGGGSWMAYTSAQFGLHIASQPQFLALKARYTRQPYPDLGRFLQSQGYRYIRLNPIKRTLGEEEAAANDALYGPDDWIAFPDLDYQGPLYGWGPSPPDQYSLNKTRDLLQHEENRPLFLFYLTQNSHYPWAPLPSFQEDWRSLNDPDSPTPAPIGEPIPHRDNIRHYREAIRYQWETLADFILATPTDKNAIFILIGDHQPPRVSRRSDGFSTPIHIIARDADFVRHFQTFGFDPGLIADNLDADMKHEGLYSMLVQALADFYGVSAAPIPYLPNGIQLDLPTP